MRAADDPHDLAKPRGKQDWLREPHSIWYPRTSGIWQTVWLERVPAVSIAKLCWASNLMRWEIDASVTLQGRFRPGLSLRLRLRVGEQLLADDTYQLTHPELYRRLALSDSGIDDVRNALLWSPETPTLIDARIELRDAEGRVIDAVDSYTAIRTIGIEGDSVILNGRPIKLRIGARPGLLARHRLDRARRRRPAPRRRAGQGDGSPSTSRGACPTCRTTPPSATTCRRSTT